LPLAYAYGIPYTRHIINFTVRQTGCPPVWQCGTLSQTDGSASLGMWHVRTLNTISIGSLGRRSNRPVIGGDLVDALVPAGLGRLILMYSQSTSGSTQPGETPVTARSGDVSSTRQHSIMEHATEARLCIRVLHKLVGLQLSVHTSIRTAMPQQTTDESASLLHISSSCRSVGPT